MSASDRVVLIVDPKLRRPACALLQAALGGNHGALARYFAPKTWLVMPTDDMVRVAGTPEEWERVAALWDAGQTAPRRTT